MPTYNSRIIREQGGSVLTIASGGSVNFPAGAVISSSATFLVTAASVQISDGASLIIKPAATTNNNAVVVLQVGRNQMWYMAGSTGSPIFSASPGDLLWLARSASTTMYVNISDGTTGSRWLFLRGTTGSQTQPAI